MTLSALTSSAHWANRWMTIPELIEELELAGFWRHPQRASWSPSYRRTWLIDTFDNAEDDLGTGCRVWVGIGGEYKHSRKVTDEERPGCASFYQEKAESKFDALQEKYKEIEPSPDTDNESSMAPPLKTADVSGLFQFVDEVIQFADEVVTEYEYGHPETYWEMIHSETRLKIRVEDPVRYCACCGGLVGYFIGILCLTLCEDGAYDSKDPPLRVIAAVRDLKEAERLIIDALA